MIYLQHPFGITLLQLLDISTWTKVHFKGYNAVSLGYYYISLFQYTWMIIYGYICMVLEGTPKHKAGYYLRMLYWFYCTLNGHVFRYTLLVQGMTLLSVRTSLLLNSTGCKKYFSKIVVHIDMIASWSCCRFVDWTSVMQISCSTMFQSCYTGLRRFE